MKVSSYQIFWMMIGMELGMTILLTMTPALQVAKQDAWISILIAGLIATAIAYITTRLNILYPNQTLVEFSQSILGKWIGKTVVLFYLIEWYTVIAIILRQYSELIQTTILQRTPSLAIIIIMLLLMIYVNYVGGIESIARTSEVLGPLVISMIMFVIILSIKNFHAKYILPVYVDTGWLSIVKGSLSPASFLAECNMLAMLLTFVSDIKKGASRAILGVVMTSIFLTLSMVMIILSLGVHLTPKMWYPFFEMTKITTLFNFFENVDALVIVIWISSIFIKLSLYLFIASYGTAQWLHIKNWKSLLWFIAPATLILTYFPKNIDQASVLYPQQFWLPYIFPINFIGIPLLLWIVGSIRKRKKMI